MDMHALAQIPLKRADKHPHLKDYSISTLADMGRWELKMQQDEEMFMAVFDEAQRMDREQGGHRHAERASQIIKKYASDMKQSMEDTLKEAIAEVRAEHDATASRKRGRSVNLTTPEVSARKRSRDARTGGSCTADSFDIAGPHVEPVREAAWWTEPYYG